MARCERIERRLILGRHLTGTKIINVNVRSATSFWWHAAGWIGSLVIYLVALFVTRPEIGVRVNEIAWLMAPLAAAIACWFTARSSQLTSAQRRGWTTLAIACVSWLIGQISWTYLFYVGGPPGDVPSPSKVFYLGYAALVVHGFGGLSDAQGSRRFTMQHLGNLGLIGCCLAVTVVIAFFEPVAQTQELSTALMGSLLHSVLVATTFFAALYYLWTHRWHATWVPMLLLVLAMSVYVLGNFVYVHALLTDTYHGADWVNATWIVMFVLIGVAATLRSSVLVDASASNSHAADVIAQRARLLEATIPALLIVLMVAVAVTAGTQLTPRVLVATAALVLMFALILGAREAWIQGESQRLTLELRNANELLRGANLELQDSEARVRDLNSHLEERVAERTRQLQIAYEELEGFAYAVAHDLKAPLRAIDGFSHLLDESLRAHADEETAAYLQRIQRGAAKMAVLIDDLLAYSRIERRTLVEQKLNLERLVAEVVDEAIADIQSGNVELTIDIPPIELYADREGLALVVRNLVQNALKFSRTSNPPRVEISARTIIDRVSLSVVDNGIGFDMQYRDQIFKLFHRLHREDEYRGTGIGLALVRKALERMNGSVHARSIAGQGATFTIDLPRRTPTG